MPFTFAHACNVSRVRTRVGVCECFAVSFFPTFVNGSFFIFVLFLNCFSFSSGWCLVLSCANVLCFFLRMLGAEIRAESPLYSCVYICNQGHPIQVNAK